MRVELALLADYATTTQDGKLIICGVFDFLRVPSLPFRHPSMHVVLRVKRDTDDSPDHEIILRMIDPDGHAVIPEVKGKFGIDPQAPNAPLGLELVLAVNNAEFRVHGPHAIDVILDGRHVERIPLSVLAAPTA